MNDMAGQRLPLDRSAAFTALLEQDREGFGKQDADTSSRTITEFLEDWYAADSTNMWEYAGKWLERRQEATQRAPEPAPERSLEERASGGDWHVTTQVSRTRDGWDSSRQVPTFTIPRWAAPTREDAEAEVREIVNPYEERYAVHAEIWDPQSEAAAEMQAEVAADERFEVNAERQMEPLSQMPHQVPPVLTIGTGGFIFLGASREPGRCGPASEIDLTVPAVSPGWASASVAITANAATNMLPNLPRRCVAHLGTCQM